MSYSATRRRRLTAGVLAGAMALTVTPILGFTGTAAADHITIATPTGDGNVCEDAPETNPFVDVPDSAPSAEVIKCMVNTEPQITKGTTATTYEPVAPVTRQQMAQFLERVADLAEANDTGDAITALPAGDGETPFTDIENATAEAQDAIDRLSDAGIALGTTATTYSPLEPVSRQQMARFLVRLQTALAGEGFAPTPTEDYFDDDNGTDAEDEFNILAEEGVFAGSDVHRIVNPTANISRQQMASVLTRKLEVFFEAGLISRLFAEDDPSPSFTEGPELASSEFVSTNATTGDHLIRYVFDEPVVALAAGAEALFHAHTVDGENVTGVEAVLDPSNSSAVLVRFAGTDIQSTDYISDLAVDAGAVHDAFAPDGVTPAGMTNPEDSVPFQAVSFGAGESMAPNVIGVENLRVENTATDMWHIRLDFVFDRPAFQSTYWFGSEVCPGNPGNVNLSLVDGAATSWSTERISADACVGDPDGTDRWTFVFASGQASQADAEAIMADLRRAHFPIGVAEDASGSYFNNRVSYDLNGGDTFGPEVVDVTLIPGAGTDPDIVRVQFDEEVTPQSDDIVVFGRNGAESWYDADDSGTQGTDLTVVDWEFPNGHLTPMEWNSHVQVSGNAVVGNDSGFVNHPDMWVLDTATYVAGDSLAPELTSVVTDENDAGTERTATFLFDKDVDSVVTTDFSVYGDDGSATALTSCVAAPTPELSNAVVCTALRGADILPAAEFTAVGDAALGGVASEAVESLEEPGFTDPANHADSEPVA